MHPDRPGLAAFILEGKLIITLGELVGELGTHPIFLDIPVSLR